MAAKKKVSKPRVKKVQEFRVVLLGGKINKSDILYDLYKEGFRPMIENKGCVEFFSRLGTYVVFTK